MRVLLTTLHDVLPPYLRLSSQPLSASAVAHFDKRWQRVGLAEVLAASDVKRYVNKARLAVAPDKLPRDLDKDTAVACETVYHYLNAAFNDFRDDEMGGGGVV